MRQAGSGWARLALVIDQILAGQRDVDALTGSLNALQSLIAEAVLEEMRAPIDLAYLASLLEQFVGARTPADGRRILEQHPQLLGKDASFVLDRVLEGAHAEGNADALHALQQRRAFLQRCREVGIDAAFRELKI